jgi:ELWxxDGT repeat protein
MDNAIYFVTRTTAGFYPTAIWVTDGSGTRLLATYNADSTLIPLLTYDGIFLYAVVTASDTQVYATLGTAGSTRLAFDLGVPVPATDAASLQQQFAILNGDSVVAGVGLGGLGAIVASTGLTLNSSQVLAEIQPQSYQAPETVSGFTTVGARVFFVDANAVGTSHLYVTDGSIGGTSALFAASDIANLTDETNATAGERLFFSETSPGGDALLEAIAPTATTPTRIGDLGAVTVQSITNADGTLYIATRGGSGNGALWVSDGSDAAPVDIQNFAGGVPSQITPSGADVFFVVGDALWEATATGATLIRSFNAIGSLYADGGTLFFAADDGTSGSQLWTYAGGTATMITDINPAGGGIDPGQFASLNGELYFAATTPAYGTELWKSDGTASGTMLADDINPGTGSSNPSGLVAGVSSATGSGLPVVTYQGQYFGYGGTDGTVAGTVPISGNTRPDTVTYSFTETTLTIAHGSANFDITVKLPGAAPANGEGALVYSTTGAFFDTSYGNPTTYTGSVNLYYIGDTVLTPVLLATLTPSVAQDIYNVFDRVTAGGQEYFLLTEQDGNYTTQDTQLWTSDGTAAGTKEVGDLGVAADPGKNAYPVTSTAIAGGFGWAELLSNASGAVSLWTATGTAGVTQITTASLGLAGTIDSTGNAGLGANGADYFFSVALTAGGTEAIATDGTAGGTRVMATLSGGAFGDFTSAGSLEYFDTGAGGALWVWNGTAATQLLSTGAYIAPYPPSIYGTPAAAVPSTASVTVGGVTWFYFVAASGGSYALERSDGSVVQTVLANGLAQNAYITEANGLIFFVADSGDGYSTVFVTDPSGTSAAPVVNPADYPANTLLGQIYGAPQNPTLLQATTVALPAPDTLFLTSGADTATGGAGDTSIYASTDTLNAGDLIDGGGGINDIFLTGAGTFDLAAPTTFANITQVISSDSGQTITLRQGTTLTVTTGPGATVFGAANSDTISGSGTITVGGTDESVLGFNRAIVTAATAGALLSNIGTVEIAGGGAVTLNPNDTVIRTVLLDQPTDLTIGFAGFSTQVDGSSGQDTITLTIPANGGGGTFTLTGNGGDDTFVIQPPTDPLEQVPIVASFVDTGANLNGTTIEGYNFHPGQISSDDTIDITTVAYTSAETVSLVPVPGSTNSSFDLVVSPDGTSANNVSITLTGVPVDGSGNPTGGFIATGDGYGGTRLIFFPTITYLTTGPDTVAASGLTAVVAKAGTLSAGDRLDGDVGGSSVYSQGTLYLVGAGTFDLSLPASIQNFNEIVGDTVGLTYGGPAVAQTIILRDGLDEPVTLGAGPDTVIGARNAALITNVIENIGTAGPGYTIDVGDARETVSLQGYIHDVINVDAATGLASVTDKLGSYTEEGTEVVNGGGIVGIGTAEVRTLALQQPTSVYLTGATPAQIVGSTGADFIDATAYGFDYQSSSIIIQPNGGGDTILLPLLISGTVEGSAAQLNGTTLEDYNFLPKSAALLGYAVPITINVTDFLNAGSVVVSNAGDVVTISDGTGSFTLTMPGLPAGGITATVTADAIAGVDIVLASKAGGDAVAGTLTAGAAGFTGTAGNDSLVIQPGALASGQTIDGGGGVNEIQLNQAGIYDLSRPAALTDFQVLQVLTGGTVTLRAGLPLDINAFDATVIGADSADMIALQSSTNGSTIVVNSAAATVIDGGDDNTISVSADTIGATIYGGHGAVYGSTVFGDTLVVTGGGTAIMGNNIVDVRTVRLGQTGLVFYGNDTAGLAITVGDPGTPDIVFAGSGGDTLADESTSGGDTLVGGAGNDIFALGGFDTNTYTYITPPPDDTIYNFDVGGSDTIRFYGDYYNITPTYRNGVLSIDSFGTTYSVTLAGTYDGTFSAATAPGGEGVDITFTGTVTPPATIPCFAAGTHIRTARGERLVEELHVGDLLPALMHGAPLPIVWIGTRRIDCKRHPDPRQVWPVRVRAHAFGPGRPHRDLFLSPDHAVFTGDVLIPIRHLIDGDAIMQINVDEVTYFHVELPAHDIVLAEGLPAESFLDTGNRDSFIGGARTAPAADTALVWEALGCAPLVVAGPALEAARPRWPA